MECSSKEANSVVVLESSDKDKQVYKKKDTL